MLTAGHCTNAFDEFGIPAEAILVTFADDWSTAAPEEFFTVTGWETHPDFALQGQSSAINDVGVIHLDRGTGLTPVDLPPLHFLDEQAAQNGLKDRLFTTVGYGLTGTNHRSVLNPKNVPDADPFRRMTVQPFANLTRYHLRLQQNTNATGSGGACNGDSGGPTFADWVDPNLEVAVVTSGDVVCRSQSSRQRLDTDAVLPWLLERR
jgi:secreted trypsin-like serine protease